jgi:hypothetical protein
MLLGSVCRSQAHLLVCADGSGAFAVTVLELLADPRVGKLLWGSSLEDSGKLMGAQTLGDTITGQVQFSLSTILCLFAQICLLPIAKTVPWAKSTSVIVMLFNLVCDQPLRSHCGSNSNPLWT